MVPIIIIIIITHGFNIVYALLFKDILIYQKEEFRQRKPSSVKTNLPNLKL